MAYLYILCGTYVSIMDEKDAEILAALKQDGRMTTREVARKTGIPISTVHKRMKKLVETGVIKRFTLDLDYDKIGKGLAAYVLINADLKQLKRMKKDQYDLVKQIQRVPNVDQVEVVIGGGDIIAQLHVADMKELNAVLLGKIQAIDGIVGTTTCLVMH